jgi:hypothetical protein
LHVVLGGDHPAAEAALSGGDHLFIERSVMIRLLAVVLCLAGLGPVPAEDKKPAEKKPAKKVCKIHNCACHIDWGNRKLFETEEMWKLSQTCWGELAQVIVAEKTEKAHSRCLEKAYAQARKSGKIVLYVGNTGG